LVYFDTKVFHFSRYVHFSTETFDFLI